MPSLNKIILVGYAGKDAEMRYTPGGQGTTSFSMAVEKRYTSKEGEAVKQTMWARVTTWGKLAETVNQYVKKGMLVMVEGELAFDPETGGARVWTDKEGTAKANIEVTAHSVLFLSRTVAPETSNSDAGDIPF